MLYQIVRDHFETFRVEAAHLRDGDGLPRFVEEEFEAYLRFPRGRDVAIKAPELRSRRCASRHFCASEWPGESAAAEFSTVVAGLPTDRANQP